MKKYLSVCVSIAALLLGAYCIYLSGISHTVSEQLASVQSDMQRKQEDLASIQQQQITLQAKDSELQNTLNTRDAEITALKGQVEDIKKQLEAIKRQSCKGTWAFGICLDNKDGQIQIIRLTNIIEASDTKLVAKGSIAMNGGSSWFFWNSSTPPSLYLTLSANSLSVECTKLLANRQYPIELVVQGTGQGKDTKSSEGIVGEFNLNRVLRCSAGDEVKNEDIRKLIDEQLR